jgi:uncharacterized protein YdaU (DUF1376 family)
MTDMKKPGAAGGPQPGFERTRPNHTTSPKNSLLWFRIFPKDLESEIVRMKPHEVRAYLLLICQAWQRDGHLPINQKDLARLAMAPPTVIASLLRDHAHLFSWGDDYLRIGLVDKELSHGRALRARRTTSARAAAAARWGTRPDIKGGDDE